MNLYKKIMRSLFNGTFPKCCVFITVFLICLLLCSCSKVSKRSGKSYDFSVVAPADIPNELMNQINKHKVNEFSLSMTDQGYLYIAVGYGEQDTGGYSIKIDYLREKGADLAIGTSLVGPATDSVVKQKKSYPFIVIKTEEIDKTILFE